MDIKMSNNAEIKLWYLTVTKEEVVEAMVKGEQKEDENGVIHYTYGNLVIIANVDKVNNSAFVITVRYNKKFESKARKEAKKKGIYVRDAFKLLKDPPNSETEKVG